MYLRHTQCHHRVKDGNSSEQSWPAFHHCLSVLNEIVGSFNNKLGIWDVPFFDSAGGFKPKWEKCYDNPSLEKFLILFLTWCYRIFLCNYLLVERPKRSWVSQLLSRSDVMWESVPILWGRIFPSIHRRSGEPKNDRLPTDVFVDAMIGWNKQIDHEICVDVFHAEFRYWRVRVNLKYA